MKRIIALLAIILIGFAVQPTYAQDVPQAATEQVSVTDQVLTTTPTPVPFSMATFAALVALIPLAVEGVKRLLKLKNSTIIQVVSWLTGLGITSIAWAFDVGFISGLPWYQMLIVGLVASLAANGAYDIGIYTYILKLMGIKTDVNEPPNAKLNTNPDIKEYAKKLRTPSKP